MAFDNPTVMVRTADPTKPGTLASMTDPQPPREPDESPIEEVGESSPEGERVAQLIEHTIDIPVFAEAVEQLEAADAADTLETLEEEQAAEVLGEMHSEAAAGALAEMRVPLAVPVATDLAKEDPTSAGRVIAAMAPDDAADLLQALEETAREQILAALPLRKATVLRRLIGYDPETAGGLMTTDYLALLRDMNLREAIELIRARSIPEGVQHLLVVGEDGRLVGVIGLRDLLLGSSSQLIGELMHESVKAVRPGVDREQVAREFDRYDYSMLPVVDLDDRVLGIVTVDDVIDIIRSEQTVDVQMAVGASAVEAVYSRIGEKLRGRFPWLSASLILVSMAAGVVLVFHDMIERYPTLAWLLPVIAAVVGNAGHQALAVTLRGIVLDEVRRGRTLPLLLREGLVGVLNGAALGAVIFVLLNLPIVPNSSWQLGLVAAIAIMLAMAVGTLAGAGIPLIMRATGIDPAQASAIVLILITDGVSFTTVLLLSVALLGRVA